MDDLREKLENLSIIISENPDGKFTACTHQEPLFCYVRDSIDDLQELVDDTLRSYVETFYHAKIVEIETVETRRIPTIQNRPIKSLTPRFKGNDTGTLIVA